MVKEEINKILDIYEERVKKLISDSSVVAGFSHDEDAADYVKHNHYILKSISIARNCLKEEKKDRALCLLGFIRGCLWVDDQYTLEELNEHIGLIDSNYKFQLEELKYTGSDWVMHSIKDDKIYWRAYIILIGGGWPVHYDEGFIFETKEDAENYLDQLKTRVKNGEEFYGNGFSCNTHQHVDETTGEFYWTVAFCNNHHGNGYSFPDKLKTVSELNEFIKEMRKKYS